MPSDPGRAAAEARKRLESQYQRDKAELREAYTFAETDQERQQIREAIRDLERQRNQGIRAIRRGYREAVGDIRGRETEARQAIEGEVEEARSPYQEAAEAIAADEAALSAEDVGSGVGALIGGTTGASDIAALMAAEEAAVAESARATGEMSAEDIGWLADTLVGESQAQQGDFRRQAAQMIAAERAAHNQRVAERIANERAMWAQALAGLQGSYRQRGWDVEDLDRQMGLEYAKLRQDAAAQNARLAMDRQRLAMERERQRRQLEEEAGLPSPVGEYGKVQGLFNQFGTGIGSQLGRQLGYGDIVDHMIASRLDESTLKGIWPEDILGSLG